MKKKPSKLKKGKGMTPNEILIKGLSMRIKKQVSKQKPEFKFRDSYSSRQELFKLLRKYWARHSEQRLGQLLHNLALPQDLFYLEDAEMYQRLKERVNIKLEKE